ncbi:MAG TPA: DnaJ domain-containing protein, partial [Polyangiaceae bacterium]
DESLLPFLAARGELPRDRVAQLSGKVPPFGRHAGAALVAHGYMRQDQLWSVLRAHAEWVIGRVVAIESGTARFEDDSPGRLRSEPSVFGGSTGAEVFVEVVRRGVAPKEAIARLGGEASRVADGANARLALECALGAVETAWLGKARGKSIGEAMASAGDPDFAAVLYALVLLGVCEAIRAVGAVSRPAAPSSPPVDPLDEEAIRARVRARMQLVDEGDYFAVLGVARDATSYEVKRAFLELRRTFEPSKLLTAGLADLSDDVRKIASVLDEAYEILKDSGRRERYRRAIDAVPR